MREEYETIRKYYDDDPKKEWNRLKINQPYEKYITIQMMERYIRPGDKILDIGGGPGHYSIHFAKAGHDVTLFDLSIGNVRFAKKKARQFGTKITAMQGDATDLSRFAEGTFDVVFLMGPLYHLMDESNRLRALAEATRVLKPGGLLFTSFILMFGGVIYGMRELEESIIREKEKPLYEVCARDESLAFEAFTYSYMTTIKDARALMAKAPDLETVTVFGQESILSPYKGVLRQSPRKIRLAWYDYAIRFCEKEEYLSHTEHLMFVSRKTGAATKKTATRAATTKVPAGKKPAPKKPAPKSKKPAPKS